MEKRFGDHKRSFNSGPKEMYKATCSDCQQECEVPFKPDLDEEGKYKRPVYCRDCYKKHAPKRY